MSPVDMNSSSSTARLIDLEQHETQQQLTRQIANEPKEPWPKKALSYKMLYLYILVCLNLLNYIDRFTVSGVMTSIKREMNLEDKEEGLLQTAFIVSYMLLAPIFGYLGDRMNRKLIIIVGMGVWIGAVVTSSFLSHYVPFLCMRMLVGVGEAAYSVVAPAIIADLFAGLARTRALVAFYIAIPVGSGLGYIIGAATDMMLGWRWGLRLPPVVGIILLLVFTIFFTDPVKGEAEHANIKTTSYLEDIHALIKIPTYVWINLGCVAVYFVTGAVSWWTPNVTKYAWQVIQQNSESPEWISAVVGAIMMLGGIFGVPIGSMVSKLWAKGFSVCCLRVAPNPCSDPLYCACVLLIAAPIMWIALYFMLFFSLIPTWVCIFLTVLLLSSNYSIATDITLYVTPPTRRSTANALQIVFAHLLGDAGSPYIVGWISDNFKGGRTDDNFTNFRSLRDALFFTVLMLPVGAFFCFMAALTVEKDRDKLDLMLSSNRESKIPEERRE